MPELFDVACHFDDVEVFDAYTNASAFRGQFSSFEESAPDGSTAKRRTMSVRPGTVIPTRRAISFVGEQWIVGDGNTDAIFNTPIRTAYWMKKSVGLVERLTPAQLCNGTAGVQLHSAVEHLKDTTNGVTDSEYDAQYNLNISKTETGAKGEFIQWAGRLLRIRTSHPEESGFMLLTCDEIESGLQSATVATAASYDPVADAYTTTTATISVVLVEAAKFYRLATMADRTYQAGDYTMVAAAQLPKGTNVTAAGNAWRILDVQPERDGWAYHIRRE